MSINRRFDAPLNDVVLQLANTLYPADLLLQQGITEKQILDTCRALSSLAYSEGNLSARHEIQHALFILNNLSLAEPHSAAAGNQYHPLLLALKHEIQTHWLSYELSRAPEIAISEGENLSHMLIELCQSHHASCHPIFDFLESTASVEQMDYFFKSDSALNILFFDLVALMLPGSLPQTRAEICKNLWDESGNGDPNRTHVGLYEYLLAQRNISLPDDRFTNLYTWQGYTGYNVFMLGATNRQHYYKSIGAMAVTELLDPPQYTKLVRGIKRLGINEKHALYYTEHIEIDVDHADGWLNNVIKPLLMEKNEAANDIMLGAVLRLNTCADYYDGLLETLTQ
ncbi:iron-containing redox enzyme family protein [Enterobacter bugandensis]